MLTCDACSTPRARSRRRSPSIRHRRERAADGGDGDRVSRVRRRRSPTTTRRPGAPSASTTSPTSCTRRARPACPRASRCATATSRWSRTTSRAWTGARLAPRRADVHVRRHRVHLQPDEDGAASASTCRSSTRDGGSTSSRASARRWRSSCRRWPSCSSRTPTSTTADLSSLAAGVDRQRAARAADARSRSRSGCPTRRCRTPTA